MLFRLLPPSGTVHISVANPWRRSRACRTSWRGCSRKRRKRGADEGACKAKEDWGTPMKRLGRFLKAALKVTLSFFVWLFRAVFKWVM